METNPDLQSEICEHIRGGRMNFKLHAFLAWQAVTQVTGELRNQAPITPWQAYEFLRDHARQATEDALSKRVQASPYLPALLRSQTDDPDEWLREAALPPAITALTELRTQFPQAIWLPRHHPRSHGPTDRSIRQPPSPGSRRRQRLPSQTTPGRRNRRLPHRPTPTRKQRLPARQDPAHRHHPVRCPPKPSRNSPTWICYGHGQCARKRQASHYSNSRAKYSRTSANRTTAAPAENSSTRYWKTNSKSSAASRSHRSRTSTTPSGYTRGTNPHADGHTPTKRKNTKGPVPIPPHAAAPSPFQPSQHLRGVPDGVTSWICTSTASAVSDHPRPPNPATDPPQPGRIQVQLQRQSGP